jgi:MarR family transcriptional regulator, 2-MHQ and catechol-resistance regulon repressor
MSKDDLVQTIIETLAKVQRPGDSASWKQVGLSHAQASMLYLLYHHDGANVNQVAEYLGITKSAVSQILDPLDDMGYVLRKQDEKDRRIIRLSLTAKGTALLKKLAKHKFAGLRSALEVLSKDELKNLRDIYSKMSGSPQKEKND